MTSHRLKTGGSGIDRGKPIGFSFDGRSFTGLEGDTLASALLANGQRLVARSFKVHRPRGILSAGPEEPCALVTIGTGGRTDPNVKAPMVPLTAGLSARSQNAWPSLRMDAMAVNALAGPALAAGFYYKTFLSGNARRWTRLFEPAIRRAAGMGRASLLPDPDRYETMNAACDVLVVGGGPAGMRAAREAAQAGADVILADERERLGGALLHERATIDGQGAPDWIAALEAELADLPNLRRLPQTTIYGHYDGQFAGLERVTDHLPEGDRGDLPRQRHWLIRPGRVVLACGAIERPIVFPGNDRPGVMLADSARAYVNRWGVAPGRRIAVFTNNDSAYATVRDLAAAGLDVAAVIDARPTPSADMRAIAEAAGAEVIAGAGVRASAGRRSLSAITVGPLDGTGPDRRIAVDTLAMSGGWTPTLHLSSQTGAAPVWDAALAAHRPAPMPDTWSATGSITGDFTMTAAIGDAEVEGAAPACDRVHPVWHVPGRGKAFVDFEHDVTEDDIALAQAEGFEAVEHLKRYTTLGMATDQGKTSNVNGLALMAAARGLPIPQAGTTRFRPPTTPVALGALAGCDAHPLRRTPMQDWHEAHGGLMQNAGAWSRPRAYLRAGETVRDAYIREAGAVRAGVGIVDVTTLGKIEVAGPDAAAFLNLVYVNGWTKLAVGKARYGVMLRDDGFVLDDGTTWRLAEDRFMMTTTTANAAKVLSHLEYLAVTAAPDMRVHLTSVSEHWGAMAVAGPKSRATLARAIADVDFGAEAFPFMAIRHGTLNDMPVMVCRLSFSGELAFEVFTPAGHALDVWEAIIAAGQADDIVPYGTEALGTLRIEKGHVSGPELDGRTTLHDWGMEAMASTAKPFVGSTMMMRATLRDPARKRLVGLRSRDGRPIPPGAQLVGPDRQSAGHVTSTTWSPELGAEIALALLADGPARQGETLTAAYPLRDLEVAVEVTSPHFVDPEGSRMHA